MAATRGAEQMSLKTRLERLEQTTTPAEAPGCVVIYDPATGEPLTPVPDGCKVAIWLPDNGRGDRRRSANGRP